MKPLRSIAGVTNSYSRRILSHVVDRDSVKILETTARRLKVLTRGLGERQSRLSPVSGKWSIHQIVCHLADVEVVFGFRLRMVIAQSGTTLQAMDEKLWAGNLGHEKDRLRDKIEVFEGMRRDHVRMLRRLPRAAWKRFGMHQERGKETIERMVHMYAGHDLNHLEQVRSIRRLLRKGSTR